MPGTPEAAVLCEGAVVEVVVFNLRDTGAAGFLAVLEEAAALLAGASGYLGHRMGPCLESGQEFVLMIWWASVEDHTMRFRQSPVYAQWRRLIDPHVHRAPWTRHFQLAPAGRARTQPAGPGFRDRRGASMD